MVGLHEHSKAGFVSVTLIRALWFIDCSASQAKSLTSAFSKGVWLHQ